jgi:autotransporter-associated beta strand protein
MKKNPSTLCQLLLLALLLASLHSGASAQTSVWIAPGPNVSSAAWTDGTNWDGGTPPDSATAVAVFNTVTPSDSTATSLPGAAPAETTITSLTLDELRFAAPTDGAGGQFARVILTAETDVLSPVGASLDLTGAGITATNDGAGQAEAVIVLGDYARLNFHGAASISADANTSISIGTAAVNLGSSVNFYDDSSAGSAALTLSGIPGGSVNFYDRSSAGSATIYANGITFAGQSTGANAALSTYEYGSQVVFQDQASAGASTITIQRYGTVEFRDQADAGTATVKFLAESSGSVVIRDQAATAGLTLDAASAGEGAGVAAGLDISGAAGAVTLRSMDGTINTELGANTLVLTGSSGDMTLSGALSGTGGLTLDTGYLVTITRADNTYSGPTSVLSGSLHLAGGRLSTTSVAAGAEFTGTGLIAGDLTNHGIVRPATPQGVLSIEGNFTQGADGLLVMQVGPQATSDYLAITGSATLDGTLLLSAPAGFTPNSSFTLLTAGDLSGQFATVSLPFASSAALRSELTYTGTSVIYQLTQLPFTSFATDAAGAALGGHLDATLASATGEYQATLAGLDLLATGAEVGAALDALAPDRYAVLAENGFAAAAARQAALDRRLAELRSAGTDGMELYFAAGYRSARFDAVRGLPAAQSSIGGGTVGLTRTAGAFTVGAELAAESGDVDLDDAGSRAESKSIAPALYFQYASGPLFVHAAAAFARDDYELRRTISYPGVSSVATADVSGRRTDLALATGWNLTSGAWTITPTAGLLHSRFAMDDFVETGAAGADLAVSGWSNRSLRSRVGFEASFAGAALTPRFALHWLHEFEDDDRGFRAAFAGAAGAAYAVPGRPAENDLFEASLSLGIRLGRRFDGWVSLGGIRARDTSVRSDISLGARCRF